MKSFIKPRFNTLIVTIIFFGGTELVATKSQPVLKTIATPGGLLNKIRTTEQYKQAYENHLSLLRSTKPEKRSLSFLDKLFQGSQLYRRWEIDIYDELFEVLYKHPKATIISNAALASLGVIAFKKGFVITGLAGIIIPFTACCVHLASKTRKHIYFRIYPEDKRNTTQLLSEADATEMYLKETFPEKK